MKTKMRYVDGFFYSKHHGKYNHKNEGQESCISSQSTLASIKTIQ